jgi:RNA polymerase-binding protein DksA
MVNSPLLSTEQLAELETRLRAEKQRIEAELSRFATRTSKDEWKTSYPDRGDDRDENAQEVAEYETNVSLERDLEALHEKVTRALERIAQGTYGYCEVGGEPISIKRLYANPEATTCLEHAQ